MSEGARIMSMDIRAVARALEGDVSSRDAVLAPGPGHSRKDRSLAVKIVPSAPQGLLVYSHAGDDWKICRDYVRARLGLPQWEPGDDQNRAIPTSRVPQWDSDAIGTEAGPRQWSEDELARIGYARDIWDHAKDPRGTLAEVYLRQYRKLDLPERLCAAVLRFHPHCPWRDENTGRTERVPALIAAFRSIDSDQITAVQRIRLNADGTKYGRRMLGIVHRAAIKLDPAGKELSVGEGLETSLAGRQLGFNPTWAVGSVGAISFFPVLDGVRQLTVFEEAGKASAEAIRICGRRWHKAGRRVRIVTATVGSDLNDVFLKEASS
jgi:hypothetical protein